MALDMVVLAKQVPDTKNVTAEAMTPEGTVNRSALPAIFNPEDMNALELALQLKALYGGAVTVITMGPPPAAQVLRDCLDRGADRVVLVTDRRFGGADTLATSYTLCQAIRKVGAFDLVLCGRQAIDGDTAQVGPQAAEKLGIPQVTYVESVDGLNDGKLLIKRSIEGGYEMVEARMPVLLTVLDSPVTEPRPPAARKLMACKRARSVSEIQFELMKKYKDLPAAERTAAIEKELAERVDALKARNLLIEQWSADDLACEPERIGHAGSPTRVKEIESVVLTATEGHDIEATPEGVSALVRELVEEHILG